MSEERHRPRSAATIVTVAVSVVVGLSLVYFLSIGPVLRIYWEAGPPALAHRFYEPLIWVVNKNPALGDLMDWYVKFWAPESQMESIGTAAPPPPPVAR